MTEQTPGAEQATTSDVGRMSLSISVATGLYGLSFGALGVAAGLSVWQTCLLSLLMFTGGSQFAFVAALPGGGWAALSAASLMGVRNAIYGAQMNAELAPRPWWRRAAAAQITIDESVAVAMAQLEPTERRRGFWLTGVGVYVFWNLLTFVGAFAAGRLDTRAWGLDGAAVAAFVALLWPRLRQRHASAVALIAAGAALAITPLVPAGVPLLVAAAVAGFLGWRWLR